MSPRTRSTTHKNHQGVYTLIIRSADRRRIRVGRHLSVSLERGLYLYTGSGQGRGSTSLEGRIGRHLSQEKKNFWHIDRILSSGAHVVSMIFARTTCKTECRVNAALLKDPDIAVLTKGVGSSDCNCESHFLIAKCELSVLREKVRKHYVRLDLHPHVPRDRGAKLCRDTV